MAPETFSFNVHFGPLRHTACRHQHVQELAQLRPITRNIEIVLYQMSNGSRLAFYRANCCLSPANRAVERVCPYSADGAAYHLWTRGSEWPLRSYL